MERPGDGVAVTVTVLDVPSTVPPDGDNPVAVALVDHLAVVDVGLGHRVGGGEDGSPDREAGRWSAPSTCPTGFDRLWQVGPVVSAPAGGAGLSVTPTPVRSTLPLLVTSKV